MGQDIWIPDEDADQPRLRVSVYFNYSDIQKYTSLVETWNETISLDVNEVTWIKKYLHDLTQAGGSAGMFKNIADASANLKLSP